VAVAAFLTLEVGVIPVLLLALAWHGECNVPLPDPITAIDLPGRAFHAIATHDGCWIFVSMLPGSNGTGAGLAVLRRDQGGVTLARTITGLGKGASGLVLTHDGQVLVVTTPSQLVFYDVGRLTAGAGDATLGTLAAEGEAGWFQASVTSDDRFLFASAHAKEAIAVINLAEARQRGFTPAAIVGTIPLGIGPGSLALSPDGRWLYGTTQIASPGWNWPNACAPIGAASDAAPNHARGAVVVIEVARAITDPAHALAGVAAAGCDPVRLALAPSGKLAWVTSRSDNALLLFDTRAIRGDTAKALLATVPVPAGPVGVAVFSGGRRVAVANATRFSAGSTDAESLTIIDAGSGHPVKLGSIPAGAGPVDVTVTADGRTLLLTNLAAQRLQIVDLQRLPSRVR